MDHRQLRVDHILMGDQWHIDCWSVDFVSPILDGLSPILDGPSPIL
jgi:hypothetical protein